MVAGGAYQSEGRFDLTDAGGLNGPTGRQCSDVIKASLTDVFDMGLTVDVAYVFISSRLGACRYWMVSFKKRAAMAPSTRRWS